MEAIISLLTDAPASLFISFFLKAFAILFSFLYLLYAIVITRQTQEMNKTFTTLNAGAILFVSALQIPLGIMLIIISLLF